MSRLHPGIRYACFRLEPLEDLVAANNLLGVAQAKPVPLKNAKAVLEQIEFTSDHNLIRANLKDYLKSGERYKDIEFDVAKRYNAPITHTGGQKVELIFSAALTNIPANTPYTLKGTSQNPAFNFDSGPRMTTGANLVLPLTSNGPLQIKPANLVDPVDSDAQPWGRRRARHRPRDLAAPGLRDPRDA